MITTAVEIQAPAPATSGYSRSQIRLIMTGLGLGMLLSALDQTIVSTALTTISRDFHHLNLYSWVVTSYLLTSTVTTPLYGKISDLFGRKRIFLAAIVIFLAGSALSGMSQSMYQLIAFRGVQGIGAGGLMSLAFAIVADVIPPRARGRYVGVFTAIFGAAQVLGPLLGGFFVDQASWRWVFYVNLPLGALALVVINRVLQLDHHPRRSHIDWRGAALMVTGMSLFLVGVQEAGQRAAVDATVIAFGAVGLCLVVAFLWWETRAPDPLLKLGLFRNRVFAVANAMGLVTGAVMFGALIFLPQYLQMVRGVTPTMSGLRMLPFLAGMLLTSVGSGQLIARFGRYKAFVVVGTAVTAVGVGLLSRISLTTSFLAFSGSLFVVGVGTGLFLQTLTLVAQNSLEAKDMGVGMSTLTLLRTLGGAIGASVLGAILIEQQRTHLAGDVARYHRLGAAHAFVHGMDQAYLWVLPVAVIAFLLSFVLREVRLRTTVGPAPPDGPPPAGEVPAAAGEIG